MEKVKSPLITGLDIFENMQIGPTDLETLHKKDKAWELLIEAEKTITRLRNELAEKEAEIEGLKQTVKFTLDEYNMLKIKLAAERERVRELETEDYQMRDIYNATVSDNAKLKAEAKELRELCLDILQDCEEWWWPDCMEERDYPETYKVRARLLAIKQAGGEGAL